MAFALRCVLPIAIAVASSNSLTVEAVGAEMLVLPEREIHQSVYRMLMDRGETNETTTTPEAATSTTEGAATTVEATTAEPTTSEATVTEAKATTSEAASSSERSTTSAEVDVEPQPKAVITGSASMSVASAGDFCANDAALEVIAKVVKTETDAKEVEVACEESARRLHGGVARRLQESVTLTYTITVEADALDGSNSSFSESSAEVLDVVNRLEALDATTLQSRIQEDLAAANIEVEVRVLEVSAPEVTIETPTTTLAAGLARAPTDASSGLSVGVCNLIFATALSLGLYV